MLMKLMKMTASGSKRFAAVLLTALLVLGQPATHVLAAGMAGSVVISGTVVSVSSGDNIAGALVYAVHLDTKQVYKSAATGDDGKYSIPGLPFGYYDIAVMDATGLYLANRVINAPAGEKVDISLALGPPQPEDTEWWSAEPDRRIPGLDRVPDGVARIVEGRPPKGGLLMQAGNEAAGNSAAVAAADSGAALSRKAASWLVPLLGGLGIIGLGILVDDDKDNKRDPQASQFE